MSLKDLQKIIQFDNKKSGVGIIETESLTLIQNTNQIINQSLKELDHFFDATEETLALERPEKTSEVFVTDEKEPITIRIKKLNCQHLQKLETVKEVEEADKHADFQIVKKVFNIWRAKLLVKNNVHVQQTAEQIKEEQIDKFIQNLKEKRKDKQRKDAWNAQTKSNPNNSSQLSSPTSSSSSNTYKNPTNIQSEIYQNRYKAQRDIILMQKSKLLEQEQRIHQLQFGQICEELKESYNDSQNIIKNLLRKFSTRTKVVTGVKIVGEPEEIQMKANKVPKLVRLMEERAQERELKRQIIQERKRLIDEEKKRLFQEQLEKKRIQDEEEKKLALDAIKERRRREVEAEKKKQLEREKYIRTCKLADKFYTKILKKRAINSFKYAVKQRDYNENISTAFYETIIIRKSFYKWKITAWEALRRKNDIALVHYNTHLMKKVIKVMTIIRNKQKQNMQVAIDYHAYQLQCKIFQAFYLQINRIKIRRYHLMTVATRHYKTQLLAFEKPSNLTNFRRILVQAFYQWKSLPAVLQLERAKEEKKRKWREKVLQVVPDYKPPELF